MVLAGDREKAQNEARRARRPGPPMAPLTATGTDMRPNTSTIASASCRSRIGDPFDVPITAAIWSALSLASHRASRIALTRPAPSAGQPFTAVFDALAPTPTISP
jgi:hypothetical protein